VYFTLVKFIGVEDRRFVEAGAASGCRGVSPGSRPRHAGRRNAFAIWIKYSNSSRLFLCFNGRKEKWGTAWSTRSSRAGGAGDPAAAADPDAVAQSYWHVHAQDKSAWTQEMDIRSPSFM